MVEKLARRLRSLQRRSLGEVLWRARVSGQQWLEKRGMGLAGFADEALLAQLEIPAAAASDEATKEHLAHRWARPWLSIGENGGAQGRIALSASEQQALRRIADDACEGRFRLLGYEPLDFGTPVDWHYDPVHRKRAPLRHWSRVPYLDAAEVGDHKIIWELNRHQFLVTLGQAFAMTGDERYATAAVGYLRQWIAANPPSRGINWSSSLEVGIRAIAWSWCLRHLVHSAALSSTAFQHVLATLVRHGLHVERYLSTYFSPNTHLTGEALALLYLGTVLPEAPVTARWKVRGVDVLEAELRRQVLDDGVYFEKSTWYQRYTVDIYLHATVLRTAAGDVPPAWWNDRIARAAEVLSAVTRPDGTIPLIGDDDGGCLLNLEARDVSDVRPTLALAARVLDRPWLDVSGTPAPTVAWMLGPEGGDASQPVPAMPPARARGFASSGWYLFHDGPAADATALLMDAGPPGRYGHAHANILGFDLAIGSEPIIADPGTFSYVGPARDQFRSGRVHSTVTLDGEGSTLADGPFSWGDRAWAAVEEWTVRGDSACLRARQEGWRESAGGRAAHERTIVWTNDGCWVICDRVQDPAARKIGITLQSGPDVSVSADVQHAAFETSRHAVHVHVAGSPSPSLEKGQGGLSRCYGSRVDAPRVRITVPPGDRKHPTAEAMLFMTFAREPVALLAHAWSPGDRAFVAQFSNGRSIQLRFAATGTAWSVTRPDHAPLVPLTVSGPR
jgi:hypothetical protein